MLCILGLGLVPALLFFFLHPGIGLDLVNLDRFIGLDLDLVFVTLNVNLGLVLFLLYLSLFVMFAPPRPQSWRVVFPQPRRASGGSAGPLGRA